MMLIRSLALLVIAVLPGFLGETYFSSLEYSLLYRMTPERRQLDYLRSLGASSSSAKEVQVFGLAGWLVGRYRMLAARFYEANKRLVMRKPSARIGAILAGSPGLNEVPACSIIRVNSANPARKS